VHTPDWAGVLRWDRHYHLQYNNCTTQSHSTAEQGMAAGSHGLPGSSTMRSCEALLPPTAACTKLVPAPTCTTNTPTNTAAAALPALNAALCMLLCIAALAGAYKRAHLPRPVIMPCQQHQHQHEVEARLVHVPAYDKHVQWGLAAQPLPPMLQKNLQHTIHPAALGQSIPALPEAPLVPRHVLEPLLANRQVCLLQLWPQVWICPCVTVVAPVVLEVELVHHRAHLHISHSQGSMAEPASLEKQH